MESAEKFQQQEITEELKDSYLSYAMSVIVSRALPDVRDGLKPVQRRILWAMWETGLKAGTKLRKSAAVVGEVMKSYHPHGDSSIYDAATRMVQDFSLRYPLIEGQGNWGSVDGDSAAAMRYTECRLAKISEELLLDIEKETVDWQPNYDGSVEEPKVLPAKLPNLLLNGTVGIAVGMATNIPPHNIREVIDASLHLIDNPDAPTIDLMNFIKGPDFPTGGIIYDRKAINEAYISGRGGITIRAVAEIRERKGAKSEQYNIEISEIPYQVNKSELIIKMADLVQSKKIEGIRDIRDESDRTGLSIIVELKNDAAPQKVLNQLYEYTDLQKTFHLNMLALQNGLQPQVMSVRDVLVAHIEHRKIIVRRRAEFDLRKAEERAHILTGLAKALDEIDAVINTIRKSADKDDARKNLISKFKFTEIQANAILEMRLQTLAALEREKIDAELKEKKAIIAELKLLLSSPVKILKLIKEEFVILREKYGDERRTKVMAMGLKEFREEDLVPQEEVIITLSESGLIKRVLPAIFKTQHRGGKGLIGSDVAEEDFLSHFVSADTHDNILFFTNRGRVFQTKVYEIPEASRTSKGKSIHNFLEIPSEEKISAVVSYGKDSNGYLVMATKNGNVKKTSLEDFENVRRSGIIAISLKKDDLLNWVELSSGSDEIVITTAKGQGIRFKESQIRAMGRGASGVRGIRLRAGDNVSSMDILKKDLKDARLLAVMANGYGKQTKISEYKTQGRGGSGVKAAKITSKTGSLIAAHLVSEETELFALSAKGQIIRTPLESVRIAGRATQGVRIMNLHAGDHLSGIICL